MSCQGQCTTAVVAPQLKSYQAINVYSWTRPYEPNAFKPCPRQARGVPKRGRMRITPPISTAPAVVVTESMGGTSFWRGSTGTSVQAGAPKCCSAHLPQQLPPTREDNRPVPATGGCACGKPLALL